MSDSNAVPDVPERQPFTFLKKPMGNQPADEAPPTGEPKEIAPFKLMRPNTDTVVHESTPDERVVFTDFRPDVKPSDAPEVVKEPLPEPVPKDESAQVPVQSSESPTSTAPTKSAKSAPPSVDEAAGKPSPPATS